MQDARNAGNPLAPFVGAACLAVAGGRKDASGRGLNLLAAVLVRVADAVEAFDFLFRQNILGAFVFGEICERSRQQPNLFAELHEGQINVVQELQNYFLTAATRAGVCR